MRQLLGRLRGYLKDRRRKREINNPASSGVCCCPGEVALRGTYPFFVPRGGVCTPSAPIKLLGNVRCIAEKRIAECLKKTRKKSRRMLVLQLFWIHAVLDRIICWINLDLSKLDLTDDVLGELFEAFTGKNKELKFIDDIDLSDNPRLTKLPWHIAWCKWLAVLDITDTGIRELPDWIDDLKLVTVFNGEPCGTR